MHLKITILSGLVISENFQFFVYFFSHDVAEIAGLTTFSFGEDEVDRYVMLFKKV